MAGGVDILGLTDTDEALSAAGLTATDTRHATIMESQPDADLELDLIEKVPTYDQIIAQGTDPAATPQQIRIYKALKNYAKWFVAVLLCERWNAIVQLKSDGKTRMDRFDRMDLSAMLALAVARRNQALGLIYKIEPLLTPTVQRYTPFGVSAPVYDPVTMLDEEG